MEYSDQSFRMTNFIGLCIRFTQRELSQQLSSFKVFPRFWDPSDIFLEFKVAHNLLPQCEKILLYSVV